MTDNKTSTFSAGTWGRSNTTTGNKTFSTTTSWTKNTTTQPEQPQGYGGNDQVAQWTTQKGTSGGYKRAAAGEGDSKTKTTGFGSGSSFTSGSSFKGEPGTAWGALKREIDKKNQGRGGAGASSGFGASRSAFGSGTSSFGASRTGFGSSTSSSFGANKSFGTTSSFGANRSTTTTGTTSTFKSFGTGSTTSSFGKFGAAKTVQIVGEYRTSRGQPFLQYDINLDGPNNEPVTYSLKHICAIPRYNKYPVEMLRWFDYVIGGGITYVNPNPKDTKIGFGSTSTTNKFGTGLGAGITQKEFIDMTPWKLDLQYIKMGTAPEDIEHPYGTLPSTDIPQEQPPIKYEEEEEVKVVARGFYRSNKLFDKMRDYVGGSHTPGLVQLVSKQYVSAN